MNPDESKTSDGGKQQGVGLGAAPLLDGKSCAWSMDRITGKIVARADGSFYWECNDGKERGCELPRPPMTPDQMRALFRQHGIGKGEEQTRRQWSLYRQEVVAYIQGLKTTLQLMDQAALEKRRSWMRFHYRAVCGIARFFHRVWYRLRDILLGFDSYCGGALSSNDKAHRRDP